MTLTLFFTRGVSLELWNKSGLLGREKALYEWYLGHGYFEQIYWLTYGVDDRRLSLKLKKDGILHEKINVIGMPSIFKIPKIGSTIYSFLLPVIYKKVLMDSTIFKTNQMDGSWSAVIAKLLYKKPLSLRTGFTRSMFELKEKGRRNLGYYLFKAIEKIAYKKADVAYVSSRHDRTYLKEQNISDTKQISVVHNYIDTELFSPSKVERKTDSLLFVGRLNQQKNLNNLLNAVSRTDFSLDIYGDGELKDEIREIAYKKGVKLIFHGKVDNQLLPGIYNSYQFYILPSFYEGMPKTLLEAMACGCFCIGTPVSGISELITHGETGYLAEGTTSDCIYNALKDIAGQDIQGITSRARLFLENRFSIEAVCKQEYSLLKGVLNNQ